MVPVWCRVICFRVVWNEQKVGQRGGKSAIGDGISWTTPCKRRRSLKRSLETAEAKAMSLREGRLWQVTTGRDMPPFDTHDTIRRAIGAFFFRRSRLFFREAAFSSGGGRLPTFSSLPSIKTQTSHSTHPSTPHQLKQSLSKIAVNERASEPRTIFRRGVRYIKGNIYLCTQ